MASVLAEGMIIVVSQMIYYTLCTMYSTIKCIHFTNIILPTGSISHFLVNGK